MTMIKVMPNLIELRIDDLESVFSGAVKSINGATNLKKITLGLGESESKRKELQKSLNSTWQMKVDHSRNYNGDGFYMGYDIWVTLTR